MKYFSIVLIINLLIHSSMIAQSIDAFYGGHLHGSIVTGVGYGNVIFMAADSKGTHTNNPNIQYQVNKLVQVDNNTMFGTAGIYKTDDGTINTPNDFLATLNKYKDLDINEIFEKYKELIETPLLHYLTNKKKENPAKYYKEYELQLTQAIGIVYGKVTKNQNVLAMLSLYIKTIDNKITLEKDIKITNKFNNGIYYTIGEGARYIDANEERLNKIAEKGNLIVFAKEVIKIGIEFSPQTCGIPIRVYKIDSNGITMIE